MAVVQAQRESAALKHRIDERLVQLARQLLKVAAQRRGAQEAGDVSSRDVAGRRPRAVRRSLRLYVSHHYVAKLWRETGLKPHQQGTFKVSKDPAFAEKVADIVGLYLDPCHGCNSAGRAPRAGRQRAVPTRCSIPHRDA